MPGAQQRDERVVFRAGEALDDCLLNGDFVVPHLERPEMVLPGWRRAHLGHDFDGDLVGRCFFPREVNLGALASMG